MESLENPETTEASLLYLTFGAFLINTLLIIFGRFSVPSSRPNESFLERAIAALVGTLAATFAFHLVCILFGAPVLESLSRTFLFSLLVASLVAYPSLLYLGLDPSALSRVFLRRLAESKEEVRLYLLAALTLVGAWAGAIPMPLDKDRPWQVWPVSCTYGALLGYFVGLVIGTFLSEGFGWTELPNWVSRGEGSAEGESHDHTE